MSGLDDAVRLLSTASTDEERFVGLLLASKVAAEPAELRAVFDASSAFVRRLLRSPPPAAADGGGGNPYRSLALSVLASFATDAPTAARPEFLEVALEAAATLGDAAAAPPSGATRRPSSRPRSSSPAASPRPSARGW